ncbi:MAG: HNH endonuclease [Bdellovibrionota bacterium]
MLRRWAAVAPNNLHEHFRSQAGADLELNLITLCADCHSSIHDQYGG